MTTIEVRSKKRDRVYARAFDHDEARRLRAEGWTYPALAELMGVSVTAVERVCRPAQKERMNRQTLASYYRHKPECIEEGCTNRVSTSHPDRSGRCQACFNRLRCAEDERDGELRCTKCREWKPDSEFREQKGRRSRRGRSSWCRRCETENRCAHREANAVQARASDVAAKRVKRGGSPMAKFMVLFKSGDGWQEKGTVEAPTRERAIESTADAEGVWAAVPAGQLREFAIRRVEAFKVSTNGAGPKG